MNKFEWIEDTSKFNEDSVKNYNEESNKGYFSEVDAQHPEKLQRMKIEKVEKLVTNLHDKVENVIYIRNKSFNSRFWKKLLEWLNLIKILA